jgi:hypothetical protein
MGWLYVYEHNPRGGGAHGLLTRATSSDCLIWPFFSQARIPLASGGRVWVRRSRSRATPEG